MGIRSSSSIKIIRQSDSGKGKTLPVATVVPVKTKKRIDKGSCNDLTGFFTFKEAEELAAKLDIPKLMDSYSAKMEFIRKLDDFLEKYGTQNSNYWPAATITTATFLTRDKKYQITVDNESRESKLSGVDSYDRGNIKIAKIDGRKKIDPWTTLGYVSIGHNVPQHNSVPTVVVDSPEKLEANVLLQAMTKYIMNS